MSSDVILLVVGAIVAGFVQGLSGFAFSMVAMSFWAWGLDPKLASVMAVIGSFTGQLVSVFSVKRRLAFGDLAPYLAGALVGIPLGVIVLPYLDPTIFKFGFGLVLLLWCPVMLFSRSMPPLRFGGRVADALAGAGGGFMGGIGGLTGAIPTLWCMLRGLEKEHQRAIIQNFNLSTLAVTLVAYIATGVVTREMLPLIPLVIGSLLIPSILGARLYIGLSQDAFRRIVLTLLTLSGVAMLAASVPKVFGLG